MRCRECSVSPSSTTCVPRAPRRAPASDILSQARKKSLRKTEDLTGEDTRSARTAVPLNPNKHFWFNDGTILIVAGDAVIFKVYSGNLTYYSDLFAEMISSATIGRTTPSVPELEGCDAVLNLPESGEDIAMLLDILIGKR